jgi:hypothetical protein
MLLHWQNGLCGAIRLFLSESSSSPRDELARRRFEGTFGLLETSDVIRTLWQCIDIVHV